MFNLFKKSALKTIDKPATDRAIEAYKENGTTELRIGQDYEISFVYRY